MFPPTCASESAMIRTRFAIVVPLAFCVVVFSAAHSCQAAFHLWRFSEFFSSPDGSVQFVEMFDTNTGETVMGGKTIHSMSTGKTFTFPGNLSAETMNRNMLIATSGFVALSGAVTPDFATLPANFFNPAGDTITFSGTTLATITFSSVPTDG